MPTRFKPKAGANAGRRASTPSLKPVKTSSSGGPQTAKTAKEPTAHVRAQKAPNSSSDAAAAALEARLAAFGEAFMESFDGDSKPPATAKRKKSGQGATVTAKGCRDTPLEDAFPSKKARRNGKAPADNVVKADPASPPLPKTGATAGAAKVAAKAAAAASSSSSSVSEAAAAASSSSLVSSSSVSSAGLGKRPERTLPAAQSSQSAAPSSSERRTAATKVAAAAAAAKVGAAPGATGPGQPAAPPTRKAGPPERSRAQSGSDRKRFMSGKVSDLWGSGGKDVPMARSKGSKDDVDEDSAEFKNIMKQVMEMALPEMEKRDRRVYETKKLRALGATLDKGEKMPYRLLQKRAKRLESERQEKVQEDRNLGVSTNSSKHRLTWQVDKVLANRKQDYKDKMARRAAREYDIGMGGREKKGMVVIDRQQAKFFTKRANRK